MAENVGMTNSGSFFDGLSKTFDIKKCFMERAENIQNAERNILFIYNNPSSYTDDDIKFLSDQLSNEFYSILKVALDWEKKSLKK